MSRSKAIAVAFYLGAMLIGGVAGIALDRIVWRSRMDNIIRDPRERFFNDLRFTDAQRKAWDSIDVSARRADSIVRAPIQAKVDSIRAPMQAQLDSIRKARFAAWRAVLTPEQQKLYDDRQARRPRPGPVGPNDGKSR